MSTFNLNALNDNDKGKYTKVFKRIDKEGRVNDGLKWPNGAGEYTGLSRCWESSYALSSSGYSQFKGELLHRFMYRIHNGNPDMSNRSMVVGHLCDNTVCCNPEHLNHITQLENVAAGALRIKTVIPEPTRMRQLVACNACRSDGHHACVGFPCSQCVKNKTVCVKEEASVKPQNFKPGDNAGEKNVMCKTSSAKILEIRLRYLKGVKYGEMKEWVEEYGISYVTLQAIVGRKGVRRYRKEAAAVPEGWWLE